MSKDASGLLDISVRSSKLRTPDRTRSYVDRKHPAPAKPRETRYDRAAGHLQDRSQLLSLVFLRDLQCEIEQREREEGERTYVPRHDSGVIDQAISKIESLDALCLNVLLLAEKGREMVDIGRELGITENDIQMTFGTIYDALGMQKVESKLKRRTVFLIWRQYVRERIKKK